jgi:hypothetical protein
MVNVTKLRSAIASAQAEVKALYQDAVKAGENDPTALNALKPLGSVNVALAKASKKVDVVVERTTEKAKTEKKDGKKSDKK